LVGPNSTKFTAAFNSALTGLLLNCPIHQKVNSATANVKRASAKVNSAAA
jgi:hypothetical protein